MKAQRQLVHVHEGLVGELPDRMLADAGKQCVAQLVEPRLQQAREVVGKHQHDRAAQELRQEAQRIRLVVQRVRRPFEEIGNEDQDDLGNHQDDRRPDDPKLQIGPVGRPHIGPQIDDGAKRIARIGGNRLRLV
ncbi:hypothetical protein D3C87_1608510 [compost metagenome]